MIPPTNEPQFDEVDRNTMGLHATDKAKKTVPLENKPSNATSEASSRRTSKAVTSVKRTKWRRHKNRRTSVFRILERERDRVEEESRKDVISLVKVTCRNAVYFVLLYAAILCCRAAITTYMEGVTDELRKKYSFASSQISLIRGTQVIGLIVSLIFVALLGRSCHKPLLLACGIFVCSIGTIIFPLPYFIEKTSGEQEQMNCTVLSVFQTQTAVYDPRVDGLPLYSYAQACQYGQWNTSYISPCSNCLTNTAWLNYRQRAFSILCIAGFLVGLGTGLFVTTGFVYVEESGSRKNGPIFYGVFLSMTGFGHFLGSCMTWWFLGYSEDLNDGLSSRLDWTIKAWWLGFVFFSTFLFLSFWIFLFFPKWISEPEWSSADRRRRLRHLAKRLEQEKEARKRRKERRKRKRREELKNSSSTRRMQTSNQRSSNEYVCARDLTTPLSSIPDLALAISGSTDLTESASGLKVNVLVPTGNDSSSSGSDSELESAEQETSLTSPSGVLGENGSGLEIIVEEDSHLSRLPSSAVSPEAFDPVQPPMGDDESPVWPLHNPNEENRQSRVVTFASGVPDVAGKQSSDLTRYTDRKPRSEKKEISRQQISRTIAKPFTALKRTIMTPVYCFCLIGTVLSAYLPAGYRSNVVQFAQVQYNQAHIYSWFYTAGLCYSIAETIGPLVGGIIVHKLRLSLLRQVEMIVCLLIVNIILFVLIFPVSSTTGEYQWQNGTLDYSVLSGCNSKCDCLDVQLDTVCSPDGLMFFSACHAGCTQLSLQNSSIVYSNCACASNMLASSSFCSGGSSLYGAFWILLFLSVVAHSMGQVSVVLIFLRSVGEDDRHMALSVAIWVVVVAAFIPGPPVFDALQSASCGASRLNCHGESTCWIHDRNHYRYIIHGANTVFQMMAICFFFAAVYFLRLDPIEAIGYSKEEAKSGIVPSQNAAEARSGGAERVTEAGRQSMMELVQSRIASSLLANQPEMMTYQSINLPTAAGKEWSERKKARGSTDSNDSVFLRDKVSQIQPEVVSEWLEEDQSVDPVFARTDPNYGSGVGKINDAFEAEPEEEAEAVNDDAYRDYVIDEDAGRLAWEKEDEDGASAVTNNTRL